MIQTCATEEFFEGALDLGHIHRSPNYIIYLDFIYQKKISSFFSDVCIRVIRKITNILYYNFAWEYFLYPAFVAFFDKTYFWNFQNGGFGEIFDLTVFCQSLLHFENFIEIFLSKFFESNS